MAAGAFMAGPARRRLRSSGGARKLERRHERGVTRGSEPAQGEQVFSFAGEQAAPAPPALRRQPAPLAHRRCCSLLAPARASVPRVTPRSWRRSSCPPPLLRGVARGSRADAPAATRQFLTAQLRDRPYEVFCCLHLDNRHRLIHFEEVFAAPSMAPACIRAKSCARRCSTTRPR